MKDPNKDCRVPARWSKMPEYGASAIPQIRAERVPVLTDEIDGPKAILVEVCADLIHSSRVLSTRGTDHPYNLPIVWDVLLLVDHPR